MLLSSYFRLVFIVGMSTSPNQALAHHAPPLVPKEGGVIFQIGKDDKFRIEFNPRGLKADGVSKNSNALLTWPAMPHGSPHA